MIELPALPFAMDALAPHISKETLEYHYGKHHAGYFKKLNRLVEGKPAWRRPLREIVVHSDGVVFHNAAQAWNHTFFWSSMSPSGGRRPTGALAEAIQRDFQSFEHFRDVFDAARRIGWDRAPDGTTAELIHVPFGSVLGPDRRPLKTRSGENVTLGSLLEEARDRVALLAHVGHRGTGLHLDMKLIVGERHPGPTSFLLVDSGEILLQRHQPAASQVVDQRGVERRGELPQVLPDGFLSIVLFEVVDPDAQRAVKVLVQILVVAGLSPHHFFCHGAVSV